MLSEEEKKAIENLKEITELSKEEIKNNNRNACAVLDIIDLKSLNTVLSLITKLQKENKEKDKQIDLMAFSLADYVMYYEYDKCRNPEMIKQKAKELKQYFETKAKKGE